MGGAKRGRKSRKDHDGNLIFVKAIHPSTHASEERTTPILAPLQTALRSRQLMRGDAVIGRAIRLDVAFGHFNARH
jgi:hypothetical protein